MSNYESQTQAFSTWGDKLLQHADRLADIQGQRIFRPITLQLAPTDACEHSCAFCSVANRPKLVIPWSDLACGLRDFAKLGIRAVEITGGGNPLLYRDSGKTINDIVRLCAELDLDIGIITNSTRPGRHLEPQAISLLKWVRVSLAGLDQGASAGQYDFTGLENKLGLSYIVHSLTTEQTFLQMVEIVKANPSVRFVRIAPDCRTDAAVKFKEKWEHVLDALDGRFFVKEINENYKPYPGGCWVGMLRPYWTSEGVYICTSHVLKTQRVEPDWRLCGALEITKAWEKMNARFAAGLPPYEIDLSKCWHCYYANNNRILHAITHELPDKNFA